MWDLVEVYVFLEEGTFGSSDLEPELDEFSSGGG